MSPTTPSSTTEPITYRQELARAIFAKIQSGDSGAVIGAASMGKSRLLQFMLRRDVRAHYLGKAEATTLLVWIDCNRLVAFSAWGLHELLLTGLLEASVAHAVAQEQRPALIELRREAILERNKLLAQRNVELALQIFCHELNLQICFIFDEFDEAYQRLSPRALASLRALRDRHKYRVNYLLLLRQLPNDLRAPEGCEGFYELFSDALMGLPPYSPIDAQGMIERLVARRPQELRMPDASALQQLLWLSGGHPGLIRVLVEGIANTALDTEPSAADWLAWAQAQPQAQEECRKLWEGLPLQERETLHHIAQKIDTDFRGRIPLWLKGLICEGSPRTLHLFSPLFAHYAATQSPKTQRGLRLDAQAGTVWIDDTPAQSLAAQEFTLLTFLYDHLGELCSVEQIIAHLYPADKVYEETERRITALVRRIRKKIEPDPAHPRYLLNVHGRGYKLVDQAGERDPVK